MVNPWMEAVVGPAMEAEVGPEAGRLGRTGFIPLDDRPCTRDFAPKLAAILGEELIMPPDRCLGHFLQPGDPPAVGRWLLEQAASLSAVVVSADMLAHGGLIASRSPACSLREAMEGVSALRAAKTRNPRLHIYASSVLMRISITARDKESYRYWRLMNEYSILWARARQGVATAEELQRLEECEAGLPRRVIDDYFAVRRRNHEINRQMVEMVADGTVDFLSICQEDAHPYGPHRLEQARLEEQIRKLGVGDRVAMYAGADEAGMLLLARHYNLLTGNRPEFGCEFYPPGDEANVAPFEDRPFIENLRAQIGVVLGSLAPKEAGSAFCLASCPGKGDLLKHGAPSGGEGGSPAKTVAGLTQEATFLARKVADLAPAVAGLARAVAGGKIAGVIDVRYPNGADPDLVAAMRQELDIARLGAFAAWNTAGNTMGTVLAHLSILGAAVQSGRWGPENMARHYEFLLERFLDDWIYQGSVREELRTYLAGRADIESEYNLGKAYGEVNRLAAQKVEERGREFYRKHLAGHVCSVGTASRRGSGKGFWRLAPEVEIQAYLPWERIFEIAVQARVVVETGEKTFGESHLNVEVD
ncbi:MAG: DUF4127 family protein [Firmicutes bacterium]|nr:DUF4127 family protein [Bacillota bacterium]